NESNQCGYTHATDAWNATATDNCSNAVSLTYSSSGAGVTPTTGTTLNGAVFNVGTTTITWKADDGNGNTQTCSFNVIVSDDDKPVFDCSSLSQIDYNTDSALVCSNDNNVSAPVASDNCNNSILGIGTRSDSEDMDAPWPLGTTTITWRFTDTTGNFKECTQLIVVSDNEDPTISCPGNINVKTDDGKEYATVEYIAPVGTDNCPGATTEQTAGLASGSNFPLGTTTNTFEVTDAAGNTATCSFNITVSDEEPPTIVCPGSIDRNVDPGVCGASVTYELPTATDNDGAVVSVVLISGPAPGEVFPVGKTTVTYRATDSAGNFAECSFTVTVKDNENPNIICPTDVVVSANTGECIASGVALGTPTGTDNCDTELSFTNDAPSLFSIGDTMVTWTATDDAGNIMTCEQKVTVKDNEKPTITCPVDLIANADAGECTASEVDLGTPSGTDNCDTELSFSNDAPSLFPIGDTKVTWTAIDDAGNIMTCEQKVTVKDNQDPSFDPYTNITQNVDQGICGAVVTFSAPTATDNCDGTVVTLNDGSMASGSVFPVGTTVVSFTATDAAGNTTEFNFTVTVVDNEDPTIECPGNINVKTDDGKEYAVVIYDAPIGNDN
ncbi:MAG: HYR domain-containing protein, partial [Thiovulaceae bacterium]|nr:HYR domain-containing protein [Sulfurimonadaceae bacterium]